MVREEDGIPLKAGDYITFSYGIPPTSVLARIDDVAGKLWIECLHPEGVKPKRERLSNVMKWYQVWLASQGRVASHKQDYRPAPDGLPESQGDTE